MSRLVILVVLLLVPALWGGVSRGAAPDDDIRRARPKARWLGGVMKGTVVEVTADKLVIETDKGEEVEFAESPEIASMQATWADAQAIGLPSAQSTRRPLSFKDLREGDSIEVDCGGMKGKVTARMIILVSRPQK